MAIDYSVALECKPKQHFGEGDSSKGSLNILARLKSKNRSAMLLKLAEQDGSDPSEVTVKLNVTDRDGNPTEKLVSMADLDLEAAPLERHAAACEACSANFLGQPFGCFGVVNYPVPASAENWLLKRARSSGAIGAMCEQFVSDFEVTGEPIHQMRQSGFFENTKAQKVTYRKGFLKRASISADQLLEPIFLAGDSLNPTHCCGVLLWFGAIKVDGTLPRSSEDWPTLRELTSLETREEKERRTKFALGAQPDSEEAKVFQPLLKALYLSWLNSASLTMSV